MFCGWFVCFFLFPVPGLERYPVLNYILSHASCPPQQLQLAWGLPRVESRRQSRRGTAWLASRSGCGHLDSYTHPTHFRSTLSAKKKTPRSSICLLVTSFFSPLRALVLPSAAPTVFTLHQPVFPPGTFSCITASVAVVLSACSSLTTPVVRTVFKPAAFLRWKR